MERKAARGKGHHNILIFRVGHLGDTVMALPALWTLRQALPHSAISWLTNIDVSGKRFISPADVVPTTGLIDEWIPYPRGESRLANYLALLQTAIELRRRRFDSVFYLMPRGRSGFQLQRDRAFFGFAGIPEVLGMENFGESALPRGVPDPVTKVVSEAEFLLDVLRSLGIEGAPPVEDLLAFEPSERESADEWLSENVPRDRVNSLIAIAPGAKFRAKEWPKERFRDVAQELIDSEGVYPIIFGGEAERSLSEWLIQQWGCGSTTAGALTVRRSAALLERCRIYLGNDTGTMHLAAAAGVRCVAIFSTLAGKGQWDPLGGGHRLFRTDQYCEQCLQQDLEGQHQCIDVITTNEVLTACRKLLQETETET